MKQLIFLLLTAVLTTSAFGQQSKYNFGLEGSPSMTFLYGNDIINKYHKPVLGFSGGFSFQYNFPKIFSIRTNVAFERKGSEYNNMFYYTNQNGDTIGSEKVIAYVHFDYLTLPLLFRASFGKKIKYFFNTGFFFGYLVKQININEATQYLPANTIDNISRDKRFDIGVSAGLGLEIPIKDKIFITFEVRNNLGLYNVSKVPVSNDGTIKTNSTNLIIGLAYKFGTRQTETK